MKVLPVVLAVLVGFLLVYTPMLLMHQGAVSPISTTSSQNGGQENMTPGNYESGGSQTSTQSAATPPPVPYASLLVEPLLIAVAGVLAGLAAYVIARRGPALRSPLGSSR